MKITTRDFLDSGAQTHGFKAFKQGLTWQEAGKTHRGKHTYCGRCRIIHAIDREEI